MMAALFIPNYTRAIGGSLSEVGLVGAVYGFALFFSSWLSGKAADSKGKRQFIVWGLFLAFVFFLLQAAASTPSSLLIIRCLAGFSLGLYTAPLIAHASDCDERMGTFASFGSLGWSTGVLLAGVIAQAGESWLELPPLAPFRIVFVISSLFFLAAFFLVLGSNDTTLPPRELPIFPTGLFARNFRVYYSFFLRNLGAVIIWTIFPLYLADLGANKFWIGALYFINTITQTLVMRQLNFKDEVKLIKAGLILSFLVFFSYSLAQNFWWIFPSQIIVAFSFSFLQVGNLLYLTKRNEEKSTSIGILNSISGICLGIGPFIGGFISDAFGFSGVIYLGAGLAFAGYLAIGSRLDQRAALP